MKQFKTHKSEPRFKTRKLNLNPNSNLTLVKSIDKAQIKTVSCDIWNQWLAGFVDGDGCFLVSKAGQLSCEITTSLDDEPMLREIQKILGGSVRLRSGTRSVRWRLTHKEGMRDLCERVNGHIRLNIRMKQFEKVCALLNITCIPPMELCENSGYIAGLWDADGSITIGVSKSSASHSILPKTHGKITRLIYSRGHDQLSIVIDSSDKTLLNSCKTALSLGSIITKTASDDPKQRRPNVHYRFYWRSFDDVYRWKAYLRNTKVGCSVKHRRTSLVDVYFELKARKAHLAQENSVLWKRWRDFCHAWFTVSK